MSLSKTATERKETQFLQLVKEVVTRYDFPMLWNTMYDFKEKQEIASDVVTFYGHNYDKMGARASFSNFFIHEEVQFTIPDVCWNKMEQKLQSEGDSQLPPRTVMISFSEKSIMLCKAAVFGDKATYLQILNADCPALCKVLGRRVSPFDERLWQKVILEVAFEVVYQKFLGFRESDESKTYYDFLIQTGNSLIAEAAPRDKIWGIGKGAKHPQCTDCRSWGKGNVLGFALMKARDTMLSESEWELL